jgi:hypothetical protein
MRTRKVVVLSTVIVGLAAGITVACSDAPSGVHAFAGQPSHQAIAPLAISKQAIPSASLVTANSINAIQWTGLVPRTITA